MRKTFVVAILSACFIFAAAVSAEEKAEEQKTFAVSGKLGCYSSIIVETTGEILSKKPGCEPSATLVHNPSGLYVSALGYYVSKDGLAEVDLYLGRSGEFQGVKYDAGVGFYNLKSLGSTKGDLITMYLGLEFPEVIGVTPLAYVEANIPTTKDILEGGWIWKVGAKKAVEIAKQPVELKFELGGNDGIYGSEAKLISFARGTVSTETKLLGLKVAPSFALQKGFGSAAEKDWRAVVGLAILFE